MTLRARFIPGRGRTIYRVSRSPWAWPDRNRQWRDGTWGNRWDDADGSYRVIYAAESRLAAYLETLANFRIASEIALAGFVPAQDGPDFPTIPQGVVPAGWLARSRLGSGKLRGRYLAIGASATLSAIRPRALAAIVGYGLELDGASIRLTSPRAFTQLLSRVVFNLTDPPGPPDGIRYASKHGDELACIALFERRLLSGTVRDQADGPIDLADPEFIRALEMHRLSV